MATLDMATLETTLSFCGGRDNPVQGGKRQTTTESMAQNCEADWEDPFFDAFPPKLRDQIKRVVPQDITLLLTG
jgi:hypothetical protein